MLNSSEDDDILKDLVSKTLQNNGVLGKIQAQLRASVFLALEEEFNDRSIPLCNKRSEELLSSPAGALAASLLQDFLSSLGLDFTSSVYGPESRLSGGLWKLHSRDQIAQKLGIETNIKDENTPVLLTYCQQILKNGASKYSNPKINNTNAPATKQEKDTSLLLKGFPPLTPINNSSNKILEPISPGLKKSDGDFMNKNSSSNLSNNLFADKSSDFGQSSVKTSESSGISSSSSMTKSARSDGNLGSVSNRDPKDSFSDKVNVGPNRLPPSNILSEPPVDEDWEDSSESMSLDNVNRKQLIKTLISEVESERTNSGGTKKKETTEKTDSEGEDAREEESSSLVTKTVSEDAEDSICTEEDVSFGDIISEGSQVSSNLETKLIERNPVLRKQMKLKTKHSSQRQTLWILRKIFEKPKKGHCNRSKENADSLYTS